jgi:hypothetical protein
MVERRHCSDRRHKAVSAKADYWDLRSAIPRSWGLRGTPMENCCNHAFTPTSNRWWNPLYGNNPRSEEQFRGVG